MCGYSRSGSLDVHNDGKSPSGSLRIECSVRYHSAKAAAKDTGTGVTPIVCDQTQWGTGSVSFAVAGLRHKQTNPVSSSRTRQVAAQAPSLPLLVRLDCSATWLLMKSMPALPSNSSCRIFISISVRNDKAAGPKPFVSKSSDKLVAWINSSLLSPVLLSRRLPAHTPVT